MEKKYYPTIGLEVHAELKTNTKMFCGCKNDPDEERPNINICPVCMAHPGALPVANKKAIENVIKVGLAIDGEIADFSEFDRKNYFYPDIPKGYQISQYKYPIVSGGKLEGFGITRVHLEEDTANNKHDRGDFSLIDFNRAGVPLMELVTDATTFESAEEAAKGATKFAKEFQLLLWYLGVSEANMEKGEMRVEANISVSTDKKKLGTKVEVKNLNSFRSVERAIKFELDRMTKLHEEGKADEIVQETRGWDEGKQKTFSQRKKEGSADYRYFPDPDLPKLKLHEAFDLKKMKADLPELPIAKRARYRSIWKHFYDSKEKNNFKDIEYDKKVNFLVETPLVANFVDDLIEEGNIDIVDNELVKTTVNVLINDVYPLQEKYPQPIFPGKLTTKTFLIVLNLRNDGMITNIGQKQIIEAVYVTGADPLQYAKDNSLLQNNNTGELKEIAQKIIDANAKVVADYKGGKEQALMSLVGQIMKETKGSANPAVAKEVLISLLK